MDAKHEKQFANTTTKEFHAQREISSDSGIGSMGVPSTSPQRSRRPRKMEMVLSGRHKFQVRDLNDESFSDESVANLTLPQLPSAFDTTRPTANLR